MKHIFRSFLLPLFIIVFIFSSCHDDSNLTIAPPPPDASFIQEFDTVASAYAQGWKIINVSDPKGTGLWTQGLSNDPNITGFPSTTPFAAWSSKGSNTGFIGADYTSTSAAAGIISNWLVSPVTLMKNGDKIVFYTRSLVLPTATADSTDYANRLQVRINTFNDGTNVGTGRDFGDFTRILLDINPKYAMFHTDPTLYDATAYPSTWTKFSATVAYMPVPIKARFAFRYYVENGGSNGLGTAIGIDSVAYISSK